MPPLLLLFSGSACELCELCELSPPCWGSAVLLVCLGHLLPRHGYRGRSIQFLPVAGTLLGAWVALTMGGPGLSLLMI